MAISQRSGWLAVAGVFVCVGMVLAGSSDPPSDISEVRLSQPFINPTLGQSVTIAFEIANAGSLDARILDRDGFVVRTLATAQPHDRGPVSLDWNGRDDAGGVVADEAYALKLDLHTDRGTNSYFPANEVLRQVDAKTTSYNPQTGTLAYRLASPARVHLQVGSSRLDPKTKDWVGPCLKTVVNRSPRTAGSVIEYWDGYDESGLIYVPDLPNFAVSLVATELPRNAIITTGNNKVSFLEQVEQRQRRSLLTARPASFERHTGLNAFEDVSPGLKIRPSPARWLAEKRTWFVAESRLDLEVSLIGPSATVFQGEPGVLMVFLDDAPISKVPVRPAPLTLSVKLPKMSGPSHRLTVNWVTNNGPVAANSILISAERAPKQGPPDAAPSVQRGGQP